ncbi:MAG: hypothetical protein V3R37_07325 [Rhodospirillales bacterium]
MRWLVILLAVTLSAAPAMAAEKTALTQGPSATVTRVVDGDTVVLSKKILGATQIRLVGIQAPKVPLGRKGFPVWPLAEASKKNSASNGAEQGSETVLRRRKNGPPRAVAGTSAP